MPTYQYACTACGEELEAVQSFTDAALTACPACQGQLRKVYSAVGVVFKGSGFYKNDSRAASKGSGESKSAGDKPAKTETAASSAGSSSTAASSSGSTKTAAPAKPASTSTPATKSA